MAITLRHLYEVLKIHAGQKIKLVAGEKGLYRAVSWVHIIETESLTRFFEGDELVFTVGLNMKNVEDLLLLIKKCKEHNATGIVVNVGEYISHIPQQAIEYCNSENFPIFEVPWDVYLANTMKICSKEIMTAEKKNMEIVMALKSAIISKENVYFEISTLVSYGFKEEYPYCAVVSEYYGYYETVVEEEMEKLLLLFERKLVSMTNHNYVFTMGNQIVFIFSNTSYSEIYEKIQEINEYNKQLAQKDIRVYTGIGRNTKSIRCINKTYKIASNVASLMERRGESFKVESYTQMGFSKLFLCSEDTEIIREYYQETLEPLVKFDEINNTDYVDFISAYFKNDCSVKETAENLFIHRNTINYKIHKVEEILNCDLSSFSCKTELQIALMLRDLI